MRLKPLYQDMNVFPPPTGVVINVTSPTDEQWREIGDKYLTKDLVNYSKDSARYFNAEEGRRQLHNDIRQVLMRKGRKGDINRNSLVTHSDLLMRGVQQKLIADKKVIHYTYNGKEIYRNNVPWSKDEIADLRGLAEQHKTDKQSSEVLGRSEESVKRKRQKMGISEEVRVNEGFRSMFGQ